MVRGRRPEEGQVRGEVLKVRLTTAKQDEMDAVRGTESRSAFARAAIDDRIAARKGKE